MYSIKWNPESLDCHFEIWIINSQPQTPHEISEPQQAMAQKIWSDPLFERDSSNF